MNKRQEVEFQDENESDGIAIDEVTVKLPSLKVKRPADEALTAALLAYRENPQSIDNHNALLVLIFQSVDVQARNLVFKRFNTLEHRIDELVNRTRKRIENEEVGKSDDHQEDDAEDFQMEANDSESGATSEVTNLQLLANFEFRRNGRSIYNYVQQKTLDIARNMETEVFIRDGGFFSKEMKAKFQELQFQNTGKKGLRSGTHVETPLEPVDDDDDLRPISYPAGYKVSETPMRESHLRVNSLAQKLSSMAVDMVGKTVSYVDENGTKTSSARLTEKHRIIWLAWLGLADPTFIDISEEELALRLGKGKATVTRGSTRVFAYMLQHSDFPKIMVLMKPNRYFNEEVGSTEMLALQAALSRPGGKGFFRTCVHKWLGENT